MSGLPGDPAGGLVGPAPAGGVVAPPPVGGVIAPGPAGGLVAPGPAGGIVALGPAGVVVAPELGVVAGAALAAVDISSRPASKDMVTRFME